ncbi:MAG TPA: mechanosensitive ion channel family protein [Polyangiales bacterium]|nr:mechanosensitive ion channel family protein [Polyangiales bacterium]
MPVLTSILDEALSQGTVYILIVLVLTVPLLRRSPGAAELRPRLRFVLLLVGFHLLLLPAIGVADALQAGFARDLRLIGAVCGALAGAGLSGLVVFGALAPRLRISIPRIVQDVMVATLGTVAVFGTASRAGVNLSGIVATGAVVTAVIGLSLQDTLGNVVGGLALQLDSTIRVGDWIRVQDVMGKVVEIRWRSTSIETTSWETVILPNSLLTRSQVTVLGRRSGEAPRWRSTVNFSVDFRTPPSQVIETVLRALHTHPIDNIADNPPLECLLVELGDSAARYAVRFWLLDSGRDDGTDSTVRTRVYFALTRAGIPLAIPAHAVFMTEDSKERRQYKRDNERAQRLSALSEIALLRDLSDSERAELVDWLQRAPFAKGEVLTREGAEAHHLYLITKGRVSVRTHQKGSQGKEVAQLGPGECFGEMSLLTGEPRSATTVAITDVECWRLHADAFRKLLERRSDLASKMATQLAERRVGLMSSREQLANHKTLVEMNERDLLDKIRAFFQL